jgi:hypothetical protein
MRSCNWVAWVDGMEETTTCTGEHAWDAVRAVADELEVRR